MLAVAADDERPALRVLRAVRPPAGAQDALEVGRVERAILERTDGATARDRRPDRVVGHRAIVRGGAERRGVGCPRRPGQRHLGERAEAARRGRHGIELRFAVGDALGVGRGGDPAGLRPGPSGPPRACGEEPRDGPAIARVLVQPRVLAAGHDHRFDRGRVRVAGASSADRRLPGVPCGLPGRRCPRRRGPAAPAPVARDRRRRAHLRDAMAARPQVDPGGQPGERVGDRVGDRQLREAERLAREPQGVGGRRGRDDGRHPRVGGTGEDRPDRAHRVAGDGTDRDLRASEERLERGERVQPELPGADRQRLGRVGAVTADIDRQAVEPGGVEEDRVGEGPVAGRFPAVDERDTRTWRTAACGDEPGRQLQQAGSHGHGLERQPEVGRGQRRWVLARIAGAGAIRERESVGEPQRCGREGRDQPSATDDPHAARGRHDRPTCQAWVAVAVSPGRRRTPATTDARPVRGPGS